MIDDLAVPTVPQVTSALTEPLLTAAGVADPLAVPRSSVYESARPAVPLAWEAAATVCFEPRWHSGFHAELQRATLGPRLQVVGQMVDGLVPGIRAGAWHRGLQRLVRA